MSQRALRAGGDPELDRGVEFCRIGSCDCIHHSQVGGLIPAGHPHAIYQSLWSGSSGSPAGN